MIVRCGRPGTYGPDHFEQTQMSPAKNAGLDKLPWLAARAKAAVIKLRQANEKHSNGCIAYTDAFDPQYGAPQGSVSATVESQPPNSVSIGAHRSSASTSAGQPRAERASKLYSLTANRHAHSGSCVACLSTPDCHASQPTL